MMRCTDSASTLARSRQQACKAASLRDQRTTAPGRRTDARPGYPRPARCVRQEAADVAGDPTTFPTVHTVLAALRAVGSLRAASSRSRPAPRQAGFRARDARRHWSPRRRFGANLAGGRTEEGQQFGRPAALVLVRLQDRTPFGLPRSPRLRDGLIGAGFIFVELYDPRRFSLLACQLDQFFFPASGHRRRSPCHSCACAAQSRCGTTFDFVGSLRHARGAPREWYWLQAWAVPSAAVLVPVFLRTRWPASCSRSGSRCTSCKMRARCSLV